MKHLLIDAYSAETAMLSARHHRNLPRLSQTILAKIAFKLYCIGDTRVDQGSRQPDHIEVYQNDNGDKIKRSEALLAAKPQDDEE